MSSARGLDELVAVLTLDEKAALTAGRDNWATMPVERIGIPAVRLTDGPNGARGSSVLGAGEASAVCIPCGSALGATWNPGLIERLGGLLGDEALTKRCRILLAPTLNLHRSPLAGRNFECFSEDPLLAGRAAAAYVRGVQSRGVATTPKHLAGNEAELDRYTMSSVIDERALRELYLVPFELAVREGGALGIMTAYNRLNGGYCTEDEALLAGILRGEWGFDGFVVSDWFGLASTEASPRAGLDLEMPGPGRVYGPALADAVRSGALDEALLDAQVRRLLGVLDRVGALDDDPDAPEQSVDLPEHRALAREAAAESFVLLRNEGVLPLVAGSLRSVAVLGPNADRAQVMGGGSAKLRAHYSVTPLEALRERLPDAELRHERGCDIDRTAPELRADWRIDVEGSGETFERDSGLLLFDAAIGAETSRFTARASFTPAETGAHTFTLRQSGRARLSVAGAVVLDGFEDPPPRGEAMIGLVSEEIAAEVPLTAGEPVELVVEGTGEGAFATLHGAVIGMRPPVADDLVARAAAAAGACDAAVLVVGTTDEWESEGQDRDSMDLPGDQDALVEAVLDANPDTIVVVNAASPVTMPWADRARAVLVTWFGGQEMAHALAAVLLGEAEPGGRLPTTQPLRVEHNPSYGSFPGENGEVRYGEGVLMGYRWYDARSLPVRFPFGHGLSYTSFSLGEPRLSAETFTPGSALTVAVEVTNTGDRAGSEVVQLYVEPPPSELVRPPRELRAFAKVSLAPGESATVELELGDRAFACWDPGDPSWEGLLPRAATSPMIRSDERRRTSGGWRIDRGEYVLRVGRSSADLPHAVPVRVG
ncbi:MAG TPA: glycoside hydrolase family 3 C-terminal domain-containing protein [Solirubrobacteraceae bacterium]|nr:glycoside hydrolase family 3 C-terminal domain-containing protein [Solirubrobacteraceae bacterium]